MAATPAQVPKRVPARREPVYHRLDLSTVPPHLASRRLAFRRPEIQFRSLHNNTSAAHTKE